MRIGADIGLVCENCGRRVLVERSALERRLKLVLERGAEVEDQPFSPSEVPARELTAGALGLTVGDVLETLAPMAVTIGYFYSTSTETGFGRLVEGQRVRVPEPPPVDATQLLLEPVEYAQFEQRYVPGGVRSHQSYRGYGIVANCAEIARFFRPVVRRVAGREE